MALIDSILSANLIFKAMYCQLEEILIWMKISFSFFNLEDPVFAPNINLLRVVLNREEILRSGRISLDYSGQLDDGSSMLFSYYRDEKIFKSGRQKNGRINGIVLVRAMFGLARKLYMVTRSFLKIIGQMLAMSFMKIMGLNLVTLNL